MTTRHGIARIDCDICCYAVASACDGKRWIYKGEEFESKLLLNKILQQDKVDDSVVTVTKTPAVWKSVQESACSYLEKIISVLDMDYELYISGKSNFRYQVATILPYKGNRGIEKPFHLDAIRQFYVDFYGAKVSIQKEADDLIGEEYSQEDGDVIVTLDKDLNCIPGEHFNWQKGEYRFISELEADQHFYTQVLTGDPTDNIPGLYGVGKDSKLVKTIQSMEDDREIFNFVAEQYKKRFGSYWKQFMQENCKLLWILQRREPKWEKYIEQDQ